MITVTGATGNVGRALVDALLVKGHPVTAVSRGASAPLPAGLRIRSVTADLADPTSLLPALEGTQALFVLVAASAIPTVDGPRVLAAARAAGVRRAVFLSSQGVATRSGAVAYAPMADLEEAIRNSGLEWSILRAGGFHTNMVAWAESIRSTKAVYAPFGDVALPSVDPRDIAEVAAAVLTDDTHAGRIYTLTGPEATTPRERTAALANALGHPLSFVEISRDQAREHMLQSMPEPIADTTLDILGEPTPDEVAVTPDAATILRRSPRSFHTWADRHTDLFQ